MTDGQGNTVYFSETIIIFTSNLGIYGVNELGERVQKVHPDMTYEEVQREVRSGIENYFKLQLGRPEILNRIGENIVVFDFIRENVAEEILMAQVNKIITRLKSEKSIEVEIAIQAKEVLKAHAIGNLENGGRGIGNIVESLLINPLSRYLFDNEILKDCRIRIDSINAEAMPYSLQCTVSEA